MKGRQAEEQALIYAEELRRLYEAEKSRADEMQRLSQQLEETVRRLVEAERTREEFVANCSHELRTPLTPIIGWADFMKQRDLPADEVREFAEVISRQGKRLLMIVDSLLAVARIRHNHERVLTMTPVSIKELLDVSLKPVVQEGRRVELKVDEDASWGYLHRPYVEQALQRVIENALKFSPKDSPIDVSVTIHGEEMVLSIADRGPGIAVDRMEAAFEAFKQVDGSSTRQHGGLGTGLYIAKELISAHGGRVWLEERPGGGLIANLALPRRRSEDMLDQ